MALSEKLLLVYELKSIIGISIITGLKNGIPNQEHLQYLLDKQIQEFKNGS